MAGPVRVFLFGTLRYPALLEVVSGVLPKLRSAELTGWRVSGVADGVFPLLIREGGAVASGDVVEVDQDVMDRLVHYEDAFGYGVAEVLVHVEGQELPAKVFVPDEQQWQPAGVWSLDEWVDVASERSLIAAREIMGYMGRFSGAALQFRRGQIEARAQGQVAARAMARPRVGLDTEAAEVELIDARADHAGYFVAETVTLRHPTFGGGMSAPITREAFVAADAAIVLPYDPVRDRVLLVEQFRMGPWRRGARYPWMLEPVAGRIDPGETPEDCVRREAKEEAGIALNRLIQIGSGYPTPGYSTEYFYIFCGLCDLVDGSEGTFGQAEEHEDIRTHVLDWTQAEDLLTSGEANNIPLVLALTWLSRERPGLRGAA
jgi:nudix-type nucleoside diphosphatase (YffH/AdpP family)